MLLTNIDAAIHKLSVNTEVGFSIVLNIVIHQQRLIAKKISFILKKLKYTVPRVSHQCDTRVPLRRQCPVNILGSRKPYRNASMVNSRVGADITDVIETRELTVFFVELLCRKACVAHVSKNVSRVALYIVQIENDQREQDNLRKFVHPIIVECK